LDHAESSFGPASVKANRDYVATAKPIAAANFVVPTPGCQDSSRAPPRVESQSVEADRSLAHGIQNNLCPEVLSLTALLSKFYSRADRDSSGKRQNSTTRRCLMRMIVALGTAAYFMLAVIAGWAIVLIGSVPVTTLAK
jgi:hypothetical protein